jgi:hypothetical protein
VTALCSPEQVAQDAILPGETLKWSGVPPRGFYWRPSDWYVVPFSIVWCVIVGFGVRSALLSDQSGPPPWILFLFVGFGLYVSIGRFVWDAYARSRTVYAVSDRAVYFVKSGPAGRGRRLAGKQLENAQVEDRPGGSGTVTFASADPWWCHGRGYTPPAFEGIPRVHDVYGLVLLART